MRLIVHIGMAKTGSTALQDSLSLSRAVLARAGVLYPDNAPAVGGFNHKYLVADLLSHDKLPRHLRRDLTPEQIAERQAAFFDHLYPQITQQHWRGTLLSAESLFCVLEPTARDRLARVYARIGAEPEVVAYLRRPSSYFASALQQHLRASSLVRAPRMPQYRRVIEGHQAIAGQPRVHLHLFDRAALAGGDIIADFATRYLAEFGVSAADLAVPVTPNESLSAEATDLLRDYRARFHAERQGLHTRDSQALIATLAALDAELGAPRLRLRPGIDELVDYARADPLWLRDGFGIEFPGLDYTRYERGALTAIPKRDWALSDLLVIDADIRHALAERLANSGWAAEDPARRVWAVGRMT